MPRERPFTNGCAPRSWGARKLLCLAGWQTCHKALYERRPIGQVLYSFRHRGAAAVLYPAYLYRAALCVALTLRLLYTRMTREGLNWILAAFWTFLVCVARLIEVKTADSEQDL